MIINGTSEGTFNPNREITRAEFITLITRAMGLVVNNDVEKTFNDINEEWFAEEVNTAVKAGLISGDGEGNFRPFDNITRQEIAVIIAKAIKYTSLQDSSDDVNSILASFEDNTSISDWAKESAAIVADAGIIVGNNNGEFTPEGNATRGETASIIRRLLTYIKFIN